LIFVNDNYRSGNNDDLLPQLYILFLENTEKVYTIIPQKIMITPVSLYCTTIILWCCLFLRNVN